MYLGLAREQLVEKQLVPAFRLWQAPEMCRTRLLRVPWLPQRSRPTGKPCEGSGKPGQGRWESTAYS